MSWANYHCHSAFCDGTSSLEEIVRAAEASGLHSVGVSSHAPLPFPMPWSMKEDRLDGYLAELDHLDSLASLPVYKSLEVDFVPDITGPARFAHRVDYTIGSIHFAGNFPDGRRLETDGPHSHFKEGVEKIYGGDVQEAVKAYFRLTRQMLMNDPPDLLGHFDKIKMQNKEDTVWNENDAWYRREVEETIDATLHARVIVEVNTRGQYLGRVSEPYPGRFALGLILERGIPVTLSSDAHHPKDLTSGFFEAARLLREIGFQKIRILHEGEWTDVPFTPDGILL